MRGKLGFWATWVGALTVLLLCQSSPALVRAARRAPVHYCNAHGQPRGCIPVPKAAKRPPKSVNEQGGPTLTPTEVADGGGLGGGPDEGRSSALEWARTQLGSTIWAYRCERFVEEAYGTRYIFASAWLAAQHVALHDTAVTSAPAGTLVFFGPDSANRGYGHVGLSLGGGKMISALETVQITDIPKSRYWSSLYRGWAYAPASWPGRIPPPPAPTGPLVSSAVEITAPAFGSIVSGTVTLEASAANVSGVAFEAYYATEPANNQTAGWHLLGDATLQSGSWALEWNTATIPNQGNALWGTINIAAIALDASGALTGTRDYRRIAVNNGGGASGGTGGSSTNPTSTTPTSTTPTQSPETTFPETTGSVVHTWTDYADAGGSEGPEIPSNDTIRVSCKISGFAVQDGNTWWYRLASSPWNNAYYGSADAFYNNGQTSGTLKGTPFVDANVPSC
jgi:NlpC/P60 family